MVKIIVDSTTDLPKDLLDEYKLTQIPLQVLIDGETYLDKVDIEEDFVYKNIREGKDVSTSLPLYDDYYKAFEKYAKEGIPFIFLTISKVLSGTYNQGRLVMDDILEKYPDAKMAIVDSKAGALAQGLIVIRVMEAIKAGLDFDGAVKLFENLTSRIEHVFMVNNLARLLKSGRISGVAAKVGSLLRIKPVLILEDGYIIPYKSAIGTTRAFKEMMKRVNSVIGKDDLIGINYADNVELADQVEALLRNEGYNNIVRAPIGSVFAAHIGGNAVGVYFFRKEDSEEE